MVRFDNTLDHPRARSAARRRTVADPGWIVVTDGEGRLEGLVTPSDLDAVLAWSTLRNTTRGAPPIQPESPRPGIAALGG